MVWKGRLTEGEAFELRSVYIRVRQQSCLYLGEEHPRKREQPGQSKSRTGLFKKQIEGGLMEAIKSGEMEEAGVVPSFPL